MTKHAFDKIMGDGFVMVRPVGGFEVHVSDIRESIERRQEPLGKEFEAAIFSDLEELYDGSPSVLANQHRDAWPDIEADIADLERLLK